MPRNKVCKRDLEAIRSGDDTEDFADGNTDQAIFTSYTSNLYPNYLEMQISELSQEDRARRNVQ